MASAPLSSLSADTAITEDLIPALCAALIEMSDKWEELGMAIALPRHVRNQCNNKRNVIALDNILNEWVNRPSSPPALGDLKRALLNPIVNEGRLAQTVFAFSIEINDDGSTEESKASFEAKHLKAVYSRQNEVPTDHWPPTGIDTCINLVLVKSCSKINRQYDYSIRGDHDDIKQEKTAVEYDDIFGKYVKGQLILVEGRPGSGKTTLVNKIAKDWGNGKNSLVNIKWLFLVPLRSLAEKSSHSISDILELFRLNKPQFIESIGSGLGEGLCFILDGWDEYKQMHSKTSVLWSLIQKKYLPEAMVVVTSRHVATADIRNSASIAKCIEVLGFSREQIYEYIKKYSFTNPCSATALQHYLDSHYGVFDMCYLPIHSAMICFLYDCYGKIPSTETQVYKEFVKLIITRSAKRHNKPIKMKSLEQIEGEHREWFLTICELAYKMMIQSKQVTHEKDAEVSLLAIDSDDESTLGLLTVDKALSLCDVTNTYAFLHLTLQEFLAAYYISHLGEDMQVKVLSEYSGYRALHMAHVFVFYCGLTQFRKSDPRLKEVNNCFNKKSCAFESQQSVVCDLVLMDNKVSDSDRYLTLRDMRERAYVVSNASIKTVSLTWDKCALTLKKFTFFLDLLHNDKLQLLERISLPWNGLSLKDSLQIVKQLQCIHNLGSLCLMGNVIDVSVAEHIGCLVGLKSLYLQSCGIENKVAHALVKSLRTTKLEILNLSNNFIGFDGKDTWDELRYLTNLKTLYINGNAVNVVSLISELETIDLTGLSLINNRRRVSAVVSSLLLQLHSLKHLHLSGIQFFGDIALKIETTRSSQLSTLCLVKCNLNEQQVAKLLQALILCHELKILEIPFNVIGTQGIPHLCDGVRSWRMLEELYLTVTNINAEGAKRLAQTIGSCEKLKKIDISHNNIQSCGALAIVNGLKPCTQLKLLGITNNNIDEITVKKIKEDMKTRPCDLYNVTITHDNCIQRSYINKH